MNNSILKAAVLISGGGTTLRNLIEKLAADSLPLQIELVISSNPRAGGLEVARRAAIAAVTLETKSFPSPDAYSQAVFDQCRTRGVGVVVMGGFLKHLLIPADFENRVVNIHPSLIPAFCGKGFYGLRVHREVLAYGAKVSGCTVHFVDNQYDHGPIILQEVVPVLDGDTPESLAARVFQAECHVYPEALRLLAEGRVSVIGRKVTIRR